MNKECVIGIDIGGTNIRIGHTDENGDLADFERISSKETFKDGNISESMAKVLEDYIKRNCNEFEVKQIAIGIPAALSADRKEILQVPNIKGMDHLFLGEELEKHLGVKVALDRDVNMLYYWDKYDKKLSNEGIGVGIYIGMIYSQYRELQSFAQFGSDLDADTKARLAQGERIVEVLKQNRSAPVPVEKQVAILYATIHDLLVKVKVADVAEYEKGLYEYLENDAAGAAVMETIRTTGNLDKDTEEALKGVLSAYTESFVKAH